MTLLNEADAIYIGGTEADAVYLGDTKVWPPEAVDTFQHLVTSWTAGSDRSDFTGEVGMIFWTGTENKIITWVGLYCAPGNTGLHKVNLHEYYPGTGLKLSIDIDLTDKTAGTFVWEQVEPFTLLAYTHYALLAEVFIGEQVWSEQMPVTVAPFAGDVRSSYMSPGGAVMSNVTDFMYVGVDLGWGEREEPVFSPADIAGLTIWLDASTLTFANDEKVTAWPNLGSGPVNNLVDAEPFSICKTNALNGLRVVRCNANGGRWRFYTTGITFDYTLIYVGRQLSAGRVISAILDTGGNKLVGFWQSNEDVCYAGNFYGPQMPSSHNDWKLYSDDSDSVTSIPRLFSNGVLIGTGSAATQSWTGSFSISGYSATGTEETCNCEVAEVLLYDRKLTDEERQQAEDYLRAKWALS